MAERSAEERLRRLEARIAAAKKAPDDSWKVAYEWAGRRPVSTALAAYLTFLLLSLFLHRECQPLHLLLSLGGVLHVPAVISIDFELGCRQRLLRWRRLGGSLRNLIGQ